jgi:hypothetical protein
METSVGKPPGASRNTSNFRWDEVASTGQEDVIEGSGLIGTKLVQHRDAGQASRLTAGI